MGPLLGLFELLSHLSKALGPTVPYHEAHGLPWCRGTAVVPPNVVPGLLNPVCVGLGLLGLKFVWSTLITFQPRNQQGSDPSLCTMLSGVGVIVLRDPEELTDFWAADEPPKAGSERSWERWMARVRA